MGTEIKQGGFHTKAAVHDPSIFADKDGSYYIFGTHMTAAVSTDLRYWKCFAKGVNDKNPLFANLFDKECSAFSFCGKLGGREYAVWAPDVSFNKLMGKYVMYFCTSGSYVKSSICMATADNPKGPYLFQDALLHSGFDEDTADKTNVKEILGKDDISRYMKKDGSYNYLSFPNCIDPSTFYDKDGKWWMVYGSWSGGIFLLELDKKTGYPIHPAENKRNHVDIYYGKKLLGGGHKSLEGPFILYDTESDFYYLFVSFGWLARDGGYQIRLFRSKKPDGPYVDMEGKTFRRVSHHEPYGLKLMGNYRFPGMECGYKSPGHNSAFMDKDGKIYIVYHQRFDLEKERHEPRVHQMFRTKNGWLAAAPFATEGEMLCRKSYHETEIAGTYYVLEHGLDISAQMRKPAEMEFGHGGRILAKDAEPAGGYVLENESRISITLKGITYESVIIQLNDEAGNPTMCFTGVGSNRSIWAVRYL